jgi:GntR family negative regulator for fad regulon and positive regulator of fabA
MPAAFVPQLLEVRGALAPVYAREAVRQNGPGVVALIDTITADLEDTPNSFAHADWLLHHRLTVLSTNPVYTLMLNGFAGFYEDMARTYFVLAESRVSSRQFYADLRAAAAQGDADAAQAITHAVMQHSIDLWMRAVGQIEWPARRQGA